MFYIYRRMAYIVIDDKNLLWSLCLSEDLCNSLSAQSPSLIYFLLKEKDN